MEIRARLCDLSPYYQIEYLYGVGFKHEEIDRLILVKGQFINRDLEPVEEQHRLEFVRWLYQQGILES